MKWKDLEEVEEEKEEEEKRKKGKYVCAHWHPLQGAETNLISRKVLIFLLLERFLHCFLQWESLGGMSSQVCSRKQSVQSANHHFTRNTPPQIKVALAAAISSFFSLIDICWTQYFFLEIFQEAACSTSQSLGGHIWRITSCCLLSWQQRPCPFIGSCFWNVVLGWRGLSVDGNSRERRGSGGQQ